MNGELTQKLKELYTDFGNDDMAYEALTLSSPAWKDSIRIVKDTQDRMFTEHFLAYPFNVLLPTKGEQDQRLQVGIPNFEINNTQVKKLIRDAHKFYINNPTDQNRISLKYEVYIEEHKPSAMKPFTLQVESIASDESSITLTAGRQNLFNKQFPTVKYDNKFYGLLV